MAKKRSDNRYQKKILIGYGVDGKAKYKYVYGRTKKELDEKYIEEKTRTELRQPKKLTVSELAEEWYAYKQPSWKPATARSTRTTLGYISGIFGHRLAKDIQVTDVDQLRLDAIRNGMASRYNGAVTALKAIYVYGIRRKYLSENPFAYAERIKVPHKQKRALTVHELNMIAQADLTPTQRAFILILLYTGVRKGEALALTVDDIDLYNRKLTVNKNVFDGAIQSSPKTEAGFRSIPLPNALYRELEDYVQMVGTGLLFPNSGGAPMRPASFALFWADIKKRIFGDDCPADFSPHLFRHNYASDLFKAGMDIKTAQYLLGHSDIKTTLDTYTHFGYDDVKIDRLELFYQVKNRTLRVSNGRQNEKEA